MTANLASNITTRTGLLGTVFRNNQFLNISAYGMIIDGDGHSLDILLVEHTLFQHLPGGTSFRSFSNVFSADNSNFYKNVFDCDGAPLPKLPLDTDAMTRTFGMEFQAPTQTPDLAPALNLNTWTGFQTNFPGTVPGPVLEAPLREFDLQASANGSAALSVATILNSGTAPLAWAASSDSPWLSLSAFSGTAPVEPSSSSLTHNCDPTGLQPGTYVGTVSVLSGTQTKKISVNFTVAAGTTASGDVPLLPPRALALFGSTLLLIAASALSSRNCG